MRSRTPVRTVPLTLTVFAVFGSHVAFGAVIGTNPPAQPLTHERISKLPEPEQQAWRDYVAASERQRQDDQHWLKKELQQHGIQQISIPPSGQSRRWLPLDRRDSWYSGPEAQHIAQVVLSFQTPAGGWSKNLDFTGQPRSPGMHFAPDNNSRIVSSSDFDTSWSRGWSYVGTFDNDATTQQLRFLAKVITATKANANSPYYEAFLRGLDYIFAAQNPNGGWPQIWPLAGGYHDAITFNDGAMNNILRLLWSVSLGTNEFSFVPQHTRLLARDSFRRGLECVLKTQVVVDGRKTVWAQQHDALTLEPCSARNYEMPSLAAGESAGIMLFLMELPEPDGRLAAAIHAAAAWFKETAIRDMAYKNTGERGRLLVPSPGDGPIWARYYEIGTNRPLFGERDKSILDSVEDVSKERRAGYAWYVDGGQAALRRYEQWCRRNPPPQLSPTSP